VKLVKAVSAYSADGTAQFSTQFWDSQKTRVCECNRGYEGYNCNLRICPKGDDPITDCDSNTSGDHTNAAAHNMVQRLWVATTDEVGSCSDPKYTTNATCIAQSAVGCVKKICVSQKCSLGTCSLGSCEQGKCKTATMDSDKSHNNCIADDGTEQWLSKHKTKADCNADTSCARCSDLQFDNQTDCEEDGGTWTADLSCNWFQNCDEPNFTTQATCEAAPGNWSTDPDNYDDCRKDRREWIPNFSDPEECLDNAGTFQDPGNTACDTASDPIYTITDMECSDNSYTTKVACEQANGTWAVKTSGCTDNATVNTWVEPRVMVHGSSSTDECDTEGPMYEEMAGYKRLDQSVFGYCSNTTHKAEGDCTGGGGTWHTNKCAIGLKQNGSCSDGASPTEVDCAAAAGSQTWTKSADTISEFETTSTDDLLGYIALKYTDMFGGEYFTRPILIDVSNSAKHSTYTQQEANQHQGTKYHSGSRTSNERGTIANGSCSKGFTTEVDCTNAGGTWTPEDDGFYLSGELANDDQKRGVLLQFTADRIRDALQDLPNFAIPKVNVTNYIDSYSDIPWGNAFDITFTDSSTSGKQNLLECVYQGHECNGSQPKMSSWAKNVEKGSHTEVDTVGSTRVTRCDVREVVETGKTLEENASCGNRGLCDTSTGICQCFEGHTGENCGTQTIFF